MNMSAKEHALLAMNDLGKRSVPFLFAIDFAMERPWVIPLSNVRPEAILYDINGRSNVGHRPPALNRPIFFEKYPMPFAAYAPRFQIVKDHIQAGNSFLVNLTCPTPIVTNLSLSDIFYHSRARYKLWFRNELVVFSPEIFIQIRCGRIASFPMKGTIDAALPNAEQQILEDPKERAEHHTIVDLIRNDLSIVATQVRVECLRYVESVHTNGKHLLQVSSRIAGDLPSDYSARLGDIVFQLLPAGSICGAPKPKTLDIIRQAEGYERGFYTGIVGLFDGRDLDCGVMIRFIECHPEGLLYKSGGGITAFSDATKEYQEMIDKVYVPIPNTRCTAAPTLIS